MSTANYSALRSLDDAALDGRPRDWPAASNSVEEVAVRLQAFRRGNFSNDTADIAELIADVVNHQGERLLTPNERDIFQRYRRQGILTQCGRDWAVDFGRLHRLGYRVDR